MFSSPRNFAGRMRSGFEGLQEHLDLKDAADRPDAAVGQLRIPQMTITKQASTHPEWDSLETHARLLKRLESPACMQLRIDDRPSLEKRLSGGSPRE